MCMIMAMRSEEFLDEIDDDESCEKCIDSKLCLFYRFWEYMYERYSEHRSCTEGDEEIEDCGIYFFEKIEHEPCGRDESEGEEWDEHINID
jgi:hypothetical protein